MSAENNDSAVKDNSIIKAEDQDWRVPIISYLKNSSRGAEKNIRRSAFKYILTDYELYHWTIKDLLLKCLDSGKIRVAMGEVQEGIYLVYMKNGLFTSFLDHLVRMANNTLFTMKSLIISLVIGVIGLITCSPRRRFSFLQTACP